MNTDLTSALIRVLPFVCILIIIWIAIQRKKIEINDLAVTKPKSTNQFVRWTFGFMIFILLIEISLYKYGILETARWDHSFVPSIIRILGAVILAPIAEELIFRGLILTKLNRKLTNMHLAIFIQAIFFVLLHSFTYENTLSSTLGIAQAFADATLFGYARHHTKSIYTPITMHATGNFLATLERFLL